MLVAISFPCCSNLCTPSEGCGLALAVKDVGFAQLLIVLVLPYSQAGPGATMPPLNKLSTCLAFKVLLLKPGYVSVET